MILANLDHTAAFKTINAKLKHSGTHRHQFINFRKFHRSTNKTSRLCKMFVVLLVINLVILCLIYLNLILPLVWKYCAYHYLFKWSDECSHTGKFVFIWMFNVAVLCWMWIASRCVDSSARSHHVQTPLKLSKPAQTASCVGRQVSQFTQHKWDPFSFTYLQQKYAAR